MSSVRVSLLGAAAVALTTFVASPARAVKNEPPQCVSPDPAQWPAPAKPYFMFVVDTSSSMSTPVPFPGTPAAPAQCPTYPATRGGHARCALEQAIQAFGGEANFGIAGFALNQQSCTAGCFTSCTYAAYAGDSVQTAPNYGCGPGTQVTRQGANMLVPLQQDHFWSNPPSTTNEPQLLSFFDNDCTASRELWSAGKAPINGALLDMNRYFTGTYVIPGTTTAIPTPLDPTNERACRSVNVILITAGDENCDTYADATSAATSLYNGVTVGNFTWNVRTHLLALVGGKNGAVIAGTGASLTQMGTTVGHGYYSNPTDSVALTQAIGNIIGSQLRPESCDNVDNNCNGCTDEGYPHFGDVQPVAANCCTLPRATCLANFQATISPVNPLGDVTKLPCTDQNAAGTPSTWLCNDPGDRCDNIDNNLNQQTDEGATKCGSPLHCPQAEVCNGRDDDCDGLTDNAPGGGSICPNNCVVSPEICDGCDNDCDGVVDNGVGPVACGLPSPANCAGQLTCTGGSSVTPGACVSGGGKTQCSNSPQPETCDGVDNNCNGIIDDVPGSSACLPTGTPGGLSFAPLSQCKMGQTSCGTGATTCRGFVGPSPEVCDGIDNDCDGIVDNNVPGIAQPCGSAIGECKPGKTACIAGALVCQGGAGPSPEVCDGLDNDCNGESDDGALSGAPPPGMDGCWDLPGNCCSFVDGKTNKTTSWCPPPGGTCTGSGTLGPPCGAGKLDCAGKLGWICAQTFDPSPEICDGLDNDCNGVRDDGALPSPIGNTCGGGGGLCASGVDVCVLGAPTCNGTLPTAEVCNNRDDDCDGIVDNDVPPAGPCTGTYDKTAYPGSRNSNPCKSGESFCDGMGNQVCDGAIVPTPEVPDGVDNDCDGTIDECGVAPDGTGVPCDMDAGALDAAVADSGAMQDSGVDAGTSASGGDDSGNAADAGKGAQDAAMPTDATAGSDGSGCSCEIGPGSNSRASGGTRIGMFALGLGLLFTRARRKRGSRTGDAL